MAAKILQIVSADSGWRAVYGHAEDPEGSELCASCVQAARTSSPRGLTVSTIAGQTVVKQR